MSKEKSFTAKSSDKTSEEDVGRECSWRGMFGEIIVFSMFDQFVTFTLFGVTVST